jgi:hypothetical protein
MDLMSSIQDEQRDCYDRLSGRAEGWKAAHTEAMVCRDIEEGIRIGLAILTNIRRRCETAMAEIENGRAEFSWEGSRDFSELYRWWLERSNLLLAAVMACEAANYQVEGAGDFRREIQDVSLMSLKVDDDRQSIISLAEGRGVPAKKAMDDLRHRVRRALA